MKIKILLLFLSLSIFSSLLTGCSSKVVPTTNTATSIPTSDSSTAVPTELVEETQELLGTVVSVKAYGNNAKEAISKAFNRAHEIENRMSPKIADSEISQINAKAGIAPVKVSPDTFFVIEKALHYASISDGAFDPGIGKLVNLWGIGTDAARIPAKEELLPYTNKDFYKDIVLNKDTHEVYLTVKEAALDLGAIAKGYTGDEMKRILGEYGIESALLNLGGNVLIMGEKPTGNNWVVGLQDPLAENRGDFMGKLTAPDKTIVTSGNYERYFIEDDVRYHHILNSKTGFPAENGVISATIITDESIDADGLSTTTFILGVEKGLALVESLPNVEAIFITEDKKIFYSSGITEDLFTLTNEEYQHEDR